MLQFIVSEERGSGIMSKWPSASLVCFYFIQIEHRMEKKTLQWN